MAQARLTDQSVLEAGIAAHLAANSDLLPPEVSELSDQAALFASNNTNAFMFTGSADADSENTNFGDSLSTKAIEKVIELDERRRKEDDPAGDASLITELAASQREKLAAMQDVTVGGVTLTLEEWDKIADALDDPATVEAVADELRAQGKTQAEISDIIYLTRMAASIAQKEARGLPLTAEEQAVQDRLETDPDARAAVKTGTETVQAVNARREADMTPEDRVSRTVASSGNDEAFVTSRAATRDDASRVERNVAVREGQSVASSVSPESMFDMAAYSPSEEFNLQGLDGIRVADADPVQGEPNPAQSEPVLGVRV